MRQFYLAGGTALALHLGHRQSRDLDFFTQNPLGTLPSLAGMTNFLTSFRTVEWELNTSEQVQWRLNDVSVTLLAYPFTHQFNYHPWRGLSVADARDVAVQKAYTVGRRAQARDYLDLHAVLTRGIVSLDSALSLLMTPQSFDVITKDLAQHVQNWARQRFRPSDSPTRGPRL